MKLIGSHASPYVRRIRMIMIDHLIEFIPINVFSPEGQEQLAELSPTRRVPVLVDGEVLIWDSMLIHKHITHEHFDIEFEKDLVLINEANDAALLLYQFKLFGLDNKGDNPLTKIIQQRLDDVLRYFEDMASDEELHWNTKGIWLYCLLDWMSFRQIIPWESDYPALLGFHKGNQDHEEVKSTQPK